MRLQFNQAVAKFLLMLCTLIIAAVEIISRKLKFRLSDSVDMQPKLESAAVKRDERYSVSDLPNSNRYDEKEKFNKFSEGSSKCQRVTDETEDNSSSPEDSLQGQPSEPQPEIVPNSGVPLSAGPIEPPINSESLRSFSVQDLPEKINSCQASDEASSPDSSPDFEELSSDIENADTAPDAAPEYATSTEETSVFSYLVPCFPTSSTNTTFTSTAEHEIVCSSAFKFTSLSEQLVCGQCNSDCVIPSINTSILSDDEEPASQENDILESKDDVPVESSAGVPPQSVDTAQASTASVEKQPNQEQDGGQTADSKSDDNSSLVYPDSHDSLLNHDSQPDSEFSQNSASIDHKPQPDSEFSQNLQHSDSINHDSQPDSGFSQNSASIDHKPQPDSKFAQNLQHSDSINHNPQPDSGFSQNLQHSDSINLDSQNLSYQQERTRMVSTTVCDPSPLRESKKGTKRKQQSKKKKL